MRISRRSVLKLFAGAAGVAVASPVAAMVSERPLSERLKGKYDPDTMWGHPDPRLELVPPSEEARVIREACMHNGKFYFPKVWVYESASEVGIPPGYHEAYLRSHGLEPGSELDGAFYSNYNLLALAKRVKKRHGS